MAKPASANEFNAYWKYTSFKDVFDKSVIWTRRFPPATVLVFPATIFIDAMGVTNTVTLYGVEFAENPIMFLLRNYKLYVLFGNPVRGKA